MGNAIHSHKIAIIIFRAMVNHWETMVKDCVSKELKYAIYVQYETMKNIPREDAESICK